MSADETSAGPDERPSRDPGGAVRDAAVTREVVVSAGALANVAAARCARAGNRTILIVADETTFRVAGADVVRYLTARRTCRAPTRRSCPACRA